MYVILLFAILRNVFTESSPIAQGLKRYPGLYINRSLVSAESLLITIAITGEVPSPRMPHDGECPGFPRLRRNELVYPGSFRRKFAVVADTYVINP